MLEDPGATLRALVPAFAFILLAILESHRPARALILPLGTRWLGNIGLYAINTALVMVLGLIGLNAATAAGASLGLFPLLLGQLPGAAQFAAAFLVLDLFSYATHRLLHQVAWLWPLHAVHHADTDVDVTTGFRHHPGERLVTFGLGLGLALILGLPPDAWATFATIMSAQGLVQHANLRLPETLDRVLRLVFVTPGMHRHHHATSRAIHDTNYGAVFSVWDRLFRSYRDAAPDLREALPIGLPHHREVAEHRLDALLTLPWHMPGNAKPQEK